MLRSAAESIDPKLFPEISLLKAAFHQNMLNFELAAAAVSILGIAAALLAAMGLLGLVAYTVSERTKEIAIRIALGAKPAHALSAILRQFVWPIAVGLLTGAARRKRVKWITCLSLAEASFWKVKLLL